MSVSGVSQLKKLSELPQGVEAVVVKRKYGKPAFCTLL